MVPDSLQKETPRYPTCGSIEHLWDDNDWEGCPRCGYLGEGSQIVHHGSIWKARAFDKKSGKS